MTARQRYRFTVLRCPVCQQVIAPLGDDFDAVEAEDEQGRIVYYHRDCWDAAMDSD